MKKAILRFIILQLVLVIGLSACTNYGKKLSKDYLEVYYKDGITKEQAHKMLDFLYPIWKSDSGKTDIKSIQLTKAGGDSINFRMVSKADKIKELGDETYYAMANLFSDSLFNGAPINIVFTDRMFKTIRTLAFKKMNITDYGEKVTAGNIEVYAIDGFSSDRSQELASFLNKTISPENTISFQISKNEKGFYLLKMVTSADKAGSLTDNDINDISSKVSDGVFSGAPLIFQLTDETFKPIKTFEYKIRAQAEDSTSVQ